MTLVAIALEDRRVLPQGREPERVPDAVCLHHVARGIDQDIERKSRLLDIGADDVRRLRDDRDDLYAVCGVGRSVACQFTEPAAAVWSPRSPVEGEEHRAFLEHAGE